MYRFRGIEVELPSGVTIWRFQELVFQQGGRWFSTIKRTLLDRSSKELFEIFIKYSYRFRKRQIVLETTVNYLKYRV
jgi:hypothetical protein